MIHTLPVDVEKTYSLVCRGRLCGRRRRALEMFSLAFFFLLLLNVASAQGEDDEDRNSFVLEMD